MISSRAVIGRLAFPRSKSKSISSARSFGALTKATRVIFQSVIHTAEIVELFISGKMSETSTIGGPVIIDGNATAATIRTELKARIEALVIEKGRQPGLAVVLVGNRTDSATYVRMKRKACAEVGILDLGRDLPADASEAEVIATVRELNADPTVDGILVQLPLPSHINETAVLDAISQEKDADGLHPFNMGCLVQKGRTPAAYPCTPWVRTENGYLAAAFILDESIVKRRKRRSLGTRQRRNQSLH